MSDATKKQEAAAGPSTAPKVEEKKKLPQLGALEDDDEFEEFSADGKSSLDYMVHYMVHLKLEWIIHEELRMQLLWLSSRPSNP